MSRVALRFVRWLNVDSSTHLAANRATMEQPTGFLTGKARVDILTK
jgi:hypothetical protein